MDRVFLDANVLFSAAYRGDSGLRRLWKLPGVVLISSEYAVAEARCNLDTEERRQRLEILLRKTRVLPEPAVASLLPKEIVLSEKDRPILAAAISAAATHLLTGDKEDFGELFGRSIAGVRIMLPARYLADVTGT